jgi:FkbM family methyltransferase
MNQSDWRYRANYGRRRLFTLLKSLTPRKLYRRTIHFCLRKMNVTSIVEVVDHDLRFLIDTHDLVIGKSTFIEGLSDFDIMSRAIDATRTASGEDPLRGQLFIDIGANIGTSTIPAVRRFNAARVIAVEPEDHNCTLLRCNLLLNGIADVVTVVPAAISNIEGFANLYISKKNLGDHRLALPDTTREDLATREIISVSTVRLDQMLVNYSVEPADIGLLWIDAQGHEPLIFDSAGLFLHQPPVTVTEYWPEELESNKKLTVFNALLRDVYRQFVDLRSDKLIFQPMSQLEYLPDRLAHLGIPFTDLLLVP